MPKDKAKKADKDVLTKALGLLNRKMYTEKELHDKLALCGYSGEEIAFALEFTKSRGYVNDAVYAGEYAYLKYRQKGKKHIVSELMRRGVEPETAQNAVDELDYSEADILYELLLQKAGEPHRIEDREYARLFRFLEGRGFRPSDIYKVLNRYKDEGSYD